MTDQNVRRFFTGLAIRASTTAILSGTLSVTAQVAFDVASIKASPMSAAHEEGTLRLEQAATSPTGIILRNATVSYCIQWAYQVKAYQVTGPDWIRRQPFDILAKSEERADPKELRIMLQTLLADRFHLKLHRETRSEPVYELVAKNPPPKLRESNSGERASLRVIDGSFVFEHVTMPDFVVLLSNLSGIDRPVVDKTGIEGVYDVTLRSAARLAREDPVSIFGSLETAGFKLASRKGPIEILVIDHVEKPSPN